MGHMVVLKKIHTLLIPESANVPLFGGKGVIKLRILR